MSDHIVMNVKTNKTPQVPRNDSTTAMGFETMLPIIRQSTEMLANRPLSEDIGVGIGIPPSSPGNSKMSKMSGSYARKGNIGSMNLLMQEPPSPSIQQRHFSDLPQEKDVLSKLPRMENAPTALFRWNTNEEIAAWLYSAQRHPEWCTLDVRIKPPNGSMILYHKKGSNYKHDGYVWKKRKDGKLPREDHMRLKVKGVEIIYANYVHSALVPTFHRRSYWLLSYPDIVLVHYLNTPGEGELLERIIPSLRVCAQQYSRAELLDQLRPMLCWGPLALDEQSRSATSTMDGTSTSNETSFDERLAWVNALIDQARQSRSAVPPSSTPTHHVESPILPTGSVSMKSTIGKPETLVLTSVGTGQILFAIDAKSPAGSALLAARQHKQAQSNTRSSVPMEGGSCSSTSSNSPPLLTQTQSTFIAPQPISQQQVSRVMNGIRSNSCSSASRRVMSSTVMRRQPSAFSEGADDVFRPLSEAVGAASSCSMAEVDGPIVATGVNDSAYCSFADTKEDENMQIRFQENQQANSAICRPPTAKDDENVMDIERFLLQTTASSQKPIRPKQTKTGGGGDPMLPAVGETADSANLGLSQEDIATTLRANLAAMIDKPSAELFRSLSPGRRPNQSPSMINQSDIFSSELTTSKGDADIDVSENDGGIGQVDEGCSNFIPSSQLLPSPDSSFRLLNQILNGEDYDVDETDEPHSLKSTAQMVEADDEMRKHSGSSSFFQTSDNYYAEDGVLSSTSGGAMSTKQPNADVTVAGSRTTSCASSHGSGGSMTGPKITLVSGTTNIDNNEISDLATTQMAGYGLSTMYNDQQRERQGRASHNAVATITDYSPDWSFTQGGTKVLISGPWYSTSHQYNCLFADVSVPACLIQTGVLRCYCPPHEPGTVRLMVCCDEQVISNEVAFEYRPSNRDGSSVTSGTSDGARWTENGRDFWLRASDSHFCMGLLERLEALEKTLTSSSSSTSDYDNEMEATTVMKEQDLETRLVNICRRMALKDWRSTDGSFDIDLRHHCGMGLLHFSAALGFGRLIIAFYQWHQSKHSSHLGSELQFSKQDCNGRTALMWACVKGKTDVASLLARGCRESLFISDKLSGELPLAVAVRDGHIELVKEVVQQFVSENGGDPDAKDLDTALWVLTSGLVERSQLFYYNSKRPYIHARRHQPGSKGVTKGIDIEMDCDQSMIKQTGTNVQATSANLRLHKQLSLDSQMIKFPNVSTTQGQNIQGNRPLENKKHGRECAKRASVEGLEELMMYTANDLPNGSNTLTGRQVMENGGINSRCTTGSDVGQILSSKITRQDSENGSSITSYMSVEDWLKQPLSVEIPMDIAVPDSPTASDVWGSVTGSGVDNVNDDDVRAQMASFAQQIIDALPDRIKQETFAEEDTERIDQLPPASCEVSALTKQPFAGDMDFMSYRHYDDTTPRSSSMSPVSTRSPGFVFASGDRYESNEMMDSHKYTCNRPLPFNPAVFTASSPSSSAGIPQKDIFVFPSAAEATLAQQHGNMGSGRRCSQQTTNETMNLGEFFSAARSRSPLECHFQELTLTDREQRQLYEAAKLIQNAYRHYRQRVQCQTYSDVERQAAIVIQTCYRRYRQYCYFKKLHQAAVLIQKHFRLYKAAKRSKTNPDGTTTTTPGSLTVIRRPSASGADGVHQNEFEDGNLVGFTQFLENAVQQAIGNKDTTVLMTAQSTTPGNCGNRSNNANAGSCIRIQVTPEELMRWKQHLAAMRIQHAFRGHRKRQDAAARKIQKFMREAKQNCSSDMDFLITDSTSKYIIKENGTRRFGCGQQRRVAPTEGSNRRDVTDRVMPNSSVNNDTRGDFSAWLSMYASQQQQKLNAFGGQRPRFDDS